MWSGNSDNILQQVPRNYMFGDKVFIYDVITSENMAHLIGDLSTFILNVENFGRKLSFFINSSGGDVSVMMNVIGLMNIARLNNIEIDTYVLGYAASAASLIAVNGTCRIMSKLARHHLHFGTIFDITTKQSEIEKICNQNTEYAENMKNLYLTACNGKLSREVLDKLEEDERGILSAKQCLKYGLCDVIVEDELEIKFNEECARIKFEEEYKKHLKDEEKKLKQELKAKKEKNIKTKSKSKKVKNDK